MPLAVHGLLVVALVLLMSVAQIVKPPPLDISCSDTMGKVYTRQDTDIRTSCLWRANLLLSYSPSPALSSEERASAAPSCAWYKDKVWFRDTSQWSGQETASVPAGSNVAVQCTSVWCVKPACVHQELAISVANQDIQFFIIRPIGPINQYDLVLFGWCAKMKSTGWKYSFSGYKGAQPVIIPSNYHTELKDTDYPAGLLLKCAGYYNYKFNVNYNEAGQYVASLAIPSGPVAELTISMDVQQTLLHLFSATSNQLSQATDMRLTWTLLPLTGKVVAFQLTEQFSVGTWDLKVNKYAVKTVFCSPPLSSTGYKVIRLHFLVNQSAVKQLSGQFDVIKSIISLTTTKNLGYVSLNKKDAQYNMYYFSEASGLYYFSRREDVEAGSSTHFIFCQQESLRFLFQIKLIESKTFTLSAHLYLNKNNTLYRSLSDVDIDVYFFNSGPALLFTMFYIVWFIPIQHALLQCEWTFNLEIYGSKKKYLFRNTTHTYQDSVANAASYIPNSKLEFDVKLYTGFVAKVNFTKSGLKPVVLKTNVGLYASKVLETTIYCYRVPCIILIFKIKKPKFPSYIVTTKGSHLSIFVSIQLNCPAYEGIKMLWRIYRVTSDSSIPVWDDYLNLPQISPINQSSIEIPKFTLNYGFYVFNVSIDIETSDDEDEFQMNTDSVVVAVQESDLKAVISGGYFRTVGFGESWTLNGSSSSDPDSPDPLEGLSFTWYCTKQISDYILMKASKNTVCHQDQTNLAWLNPGAILQTVQPELLQGNKQYYFRLVVSKSDKTSYSDQTVFVSPGIPPLISLVCIENCRQILIPTERFSLSGKCLDCSKTSRPQYEWSLYQGSKEMGFDWASKTTTGRSIAYLSIIAKTFVDIADIWYTIVLKVTTWTGAPAINKYLFFVNSPPKAGRCDINPSVGFTLQTRFKVNCNGFSDSNLPLSYKVIASLDEKSKISSLRKNVFGVIAYFGYNSEMDPFTLPVGVPSGGYSLALYVQVYDSLHSYTQTALSATVKDYDKGKPKESILGEINSLISGPSSPMNTFLETGDFIKAGLHIQAIASILNNLKDSAFLKDTQSQLRERLLNMSSTIQITNVMGVNQIIASISDLTQVEKEVTLKSQQIAVDKLVEATNSLLTYRKEILGSVESEMLSSGILTSVSNIMSASLLHITKMTTDVSSDTVEVLQKSLSAIETTTDIVSEGKVPGEIDTFMQTQQFNVSLKKVEKWDLVDSYFKKTDCITCFYPTLQNVSVLPVDAVVVSVFYEFKTDPLPWLKYRREIDTIVVGYYMATTVENERVINIIPETIDIILERKAKVPVFDVFLAPDDEKISSGAFYFELDLNLKAEWFLQFFYTKDIVFKISFYVGENITNNPPVAFDRIPNAEKAQLKSNNLRNWNPKIIRIPTQSIPKSSPIVNLSVELTTDYKVWKKVVLLSASIFNVACVDFEEGNSWRDTKCKVGPLTNNKRIHCACGKLNKGESRSASFLKKKHVFFSAKVFVLPNPVDLTKMNLREVTRNFVTLITVLTIWVIYAVLVILTRKWDNIDMMYKSKLIFCPVNDPYHPECYLVTLYTGSRLWSGTSADVFLKIIGFESTSKILHLKCPLFNVFSRGGLCTFLITTRCSLGEICCIRIWHNNYGKSPGWYLSRIKIENVRSKQVWHFLCRKWLDINKKDGRLDMHFFPKAANSPLSKKEYFLINISWSLIEQHLWSSIFVTFLPSSFRRVERLSCCLVALLCALLVNIAFFSASKTRASSPPIRSVVVGIESAVVMFPLQFLVRLLFKFKGTSTLPAEQQYLSGDNLHNTTQLGGSHTPQTAGKEHFNDHLPKMGNQEGDIATKESIPSDLDSPSPLLNSPKSGRFQSIQNNNLTPQTLAKENVTEESMAPQSKSDSPRKSRSQFFASQCTKFKLACSLWSLHIAWTLVFTISIVTSCLIILYGLSYGHHTSMAWLLASVISLCQDIFVLQVVKIGVICAFNTCFPRLLNNIPWPTNYMLLKTLEGICRKEDDKKELHCKLEFLSKTDLDKPMIFDMTKVMHNMSDHYECQCPP
ncbi:polycystin family receptor for egg jelly [Pelobates fuscus]|uniref:polycystin family receptor for egg jelly n=1 Tax=Pelobates fuscus TaxID=191477 RepID=UPI002FE4AC6F